MFKIIDGGEKTFSSHHFNTSIFFSRIPKQMVSSSLCVLKENLSSYFQIASTVCGATSQACIFRMRICYSPWLVKHKVQDNCQGFLTGGQDCPLRWRSGVITTAPTFASATTQDAAKDAPEEKFTASSSSSCL